MNRVLIFFLASVLLLATGCKHANQAEQLAALDSAYKAGLLTKEEYDTKMLALTGAEPAAAPTPSSSPTTAPPPIMAQAPDQPRPSSPTRRTPARQATASLLPSASPNAAPAGEPSSSAPGSAHTKEAETAPLGGCEDAEYKSGGQKGSEERFFAAPPEAVRSAAVSALDSLDFNIQKNANNEIEASKKRHLGVLVGAGGERVILTFRESERAGRSGTRVIGHTRKNFVGHVTQKTWTDRVLAQIGCKLRESRR
jgi:hypothetical protein